MSKTAHLFKIHVGALKGRVIFRHGIALPVSMSDLSRGMNATRPGVHLFRGAWYGVKAMELPSYGKIEGHLDDFKGKARRMGPVGARLHKLIRNKL